MFEEFEKIENADLKQFSTMRTGGLAKVVLFPKNHLELIEIVRLCKQGNLQYMILGNGSNVLFDDDGFDGVIVSLKHLNRISVCASRDSSTSLRMTARRNSVRAGAGTNLFVLNQKLAELGLSGLEWSYGIPATLGGFLVMNGGCFGHEIGEFVEEVTVLDGTRVRRLKKDDLQFSYRTSNLKKYVVLGAKLRLKCEKTEKIKQNMQFFFSKKRESQPCEFPSLGSVFKRVQGENPIFPAKLIDEMGLKGFSIGGAQVSTKHAGFIINKGGATSADVLQLIEFLETKLAERGVMPEREIIVVKNPDFAEFER